MSLNYDLTKIDEANKDFIWVPGVDVFGPDSMYAKDDPQRKVMNPKAEAIIFATMAVDMGSVTHANKVEFYLRYLLWQKLMNYGKPYFSFSDLEKMVGLTTNVFTTTNAAFKKDLWKRASLEITREIEGGQYDDVKETD